jgi:hypothetical protein
MVVDDDGTHVPQQPAPVRRAQPLDDQLSAVNEE